MKFLIIASLIALAAASSLYRPTKTVQVAEDGTITIVSQQAGKTVVITRPHGLAGPRSVEITLTGPNVITRKIQVQDGGEQVGVEDSRSKRGSRGSNLSQLDVLVEIFRDNQGQIDDLTYGRLLARVESAVAKGVISQQIYNVLVELEGNQWGNLGQIGHVQVGQPLFWRSIARGDNPWAQQQQILAQQQGQGINQVWGQGPLGQQGVLSQILQEQAIGQGLGPIVGGSQVQQVLEQQRLAQILGQQGINQGLGQQGVNQVLGQGISQGLGQQGISQLLGQGVVGQRGVLGQQGISQLLGQGIVGQQGVLGQQGINQQVLRQLQLQQLENQVENELVQQQIQQGVLSQGIVGQQGINQLLGQGIVGQRGVSGQQGINQLLGQEIVGQRGVLGQQGINQLLGQGIVGQRGVLGQQAINQLLGQGIVGQRGVLGQQGINQRLAQQGILGQGIVGQQGVLGQSGINQLLGQGIVGQQGINQQVLGQLQLQQLENQVENELVQQQVQNQLVQQELAQIQQQQQVPNLLGQQNLGVSSGYGRILPNQAGILGGRSLLRNYLLGQQWGQNGQIAGGLNPIWAGAVRIPQVVV